MSLAKGAEEVLKFALGLLLVLAAGSVPFVAGFFESPEETEAPAWEDPDFLAHAFGEACSAVERFTGIPFEARPSLLVLGAAEAEDYLRRGVSAELSWWLDDDVRGDVESYLLNEFLAMYDPQEHVVVLHAAVAQARCEAEQWSLRDQIRLAFVHEVVHAHHNERFSWRPETSDWSQHDPDQVLRAVLEGYAEFVSRRVADEWGLSDLSKAQLAALAELPEDVSDATAWRRRITAGLARHQHLQGLAFIEAIFQARGASGVEEVLRSPPTDHRVIEAPRLWLDPRVDSRPSLRRGMEAFRSLGERAGWRVTNRYQIGSTREFLLSPCVAKTSPELVSACIDARQLRARSPGDLQSISIVLFRFETEAWASTCVDALCPKAFMDALRKGEYVAGYSLGAGPEGSVYGLTQDQEKTSETGDVVRVLRQTFRFKDVVGIVRAKAVPSLDRADLDAAVERCTGILEGEAD